MKTGATLVTEPRDIIEALEPLMGLGRRAFREVPIDTESYDPQPLAPAPDPGDDERGMVMSTLGAAPVSVDDIVHATKLDIRVVRAILIELDLAGLTERHGAQLVSLANAVPSR